MGSHDFGTVSHYADMGGMLSSFEHSIKHVHRSQDCVSSKIFFSYGGASHLTLVQHSQQANKPALCILPFYPPGTRVHRVVFDVVDRSCHLHGFVYSVGFGAYAYLLSEPTALKGHSYSVAKLGCGWTRARRNANDASAHLREYATTCCPKGD
jgi:hypothetical protein